MVLAMQQEISLAAVRETDITDTVYFGGGTPSLLEPQEISGLMETIRRHFRMAVDAEVTLEANPDDISPEKIKLWTSLGVNRLSIGIQSFREEDLTWMNRAHDARQARECIDIARNGGILNLSIDLIYGTPGLTDAAWTDNLKTASSLFIPHLSCYALTVEPGTALDTMIRQRKRHAPASETQAEQFLMTMDRLAEAGYEHYEISNFALPGMRSRHNSAYWQGTRYLGIGPSAHSFDGCDRRWNVANNAAYIRALKEGRIPYEAETLNETQRLNEYVMTSLRTIEGMDMEMIGQRWGKAEMQRILRDAAPFVAAGRLEQKGFSVMLTREGKLFADGIAAELFA
jgi:oxygen-independent coproporphyrinogen-3 oxidase